MKLIELVFFRHGIADAGTPDRDRSLTEDGVRKTWASGEGLKKMAIPFDRILTSPWVRAVQTATILAEVLGMASAPEELPGLAGDHTATDLLAALRTFEGKNLLLVGHQPLLGEAVAELLGASGNCEIDIRKSGACSVQIDGFTLKKPAVLNWLMTAKQLRAMGK
jgi:phosphohistidine phosphatase